MRALLQIRLLQVRLVSFVLHALCSGPKLNLLSLPTEILHLIACEMPLESVAALSLTCKDLYSTLIHHVSPLRDDPQATSALQWLLWSDLCQSHHLCHVRKAVSRYPRRRNSGF